MTEKRCDNCKYWVFYGLFKDSNAPIDYGICHRYPPTARGERTAPCDNPDPPAHWWCGEFEPKESEEPEAPEEEERLYFRKGDE